MRCFISIISIALLVPASAAVAADFSCSNSSAEIRCGDGSCEIVTPPGGFTPMTLGKRGANLSLCAYSGCWEGKVLLRRSLDKVSVIQGRITRAGDMSAKQEPISIIYDENNRIAQMNWGGFANVMECKTGS